MPGAKIRDGPRKGPTTEERDFGSSPGGVCAAMWWRDESAMKQVRRTRILTIIEEQEKDLEMEGAIERTHDTYLIGGSTLI